MNATDKLIEYLMVSSGADICAKCVYYSSSSNDDEYSRSHSNSTSCKKWREGGIGPHADVCRKGMKKYFKREERQGG